MERPVVIVHSLAQARAALAAARDLDARVALQSPPDAGYYAGALYFRKIVDALEAEFGAGPDWHFLFDCGADAGLALNALRHGLKTLLFRGGKAQGDKLAQIARKEGAAIRRSPQGGKAESLLDLLDRPEPYATVRRWLERGDAEGGSGRGTGD